MGPLSVRNRAGIMRTVRAAILLSLVSVSLADYARCSPNHEDCSCGDKSYDGCIEPNPTVSIHVNDLAECILNCDLFNTMGQCDWLIFYNRGPDENCRLQAQGESMTAYMGTRNIVGQPTRHIDGSCMTDFAPACLPTFCPDGYDVCDATDPCNVNYHQTQCTMTATGVTNNQLDSNTYDGCTAGCIAQSLANPSTYLTWNIQAKECICFDGGYRSCDIEVVKALFTMGEIAACKAE